VQHSLLSRQIEPPGLQFPEPALFADPMAANATPARPTLNFFSAARRVTDWARLLVNSSNLLCICCRLVQGKLVKSLSNRRYNSLSPVTTGKMSKPYGQFRASITAGCRKEADYTVKEHFLPL
jgi:hypothetical protein